MGPKLKSKTFDTIPSTRPTTPLLDTINSPADLRSLPRTSLTEVTNELREFMLYTVGQTGGHFGAGMGVVELTTALHYLFDTPNDRIVWDVGHQTYPHKILTGRRDEMLTMRQENGLSGFPKRTESEYDTFGVGHSSTSISAALGMAIGASKQGIKRRCVAVIGDGAMTAGMAFEALAHAAHTKENLLVILNDNNMSISPSVGGLASYFAKIWASKPYHTLREGSKKVLSILPPAWELAKRTEEHMKGMISPATLFEELGFNYVGPLDGHDLPSLITAIENIRDLSGPQFLHVITEKGKGFSPAEKDPVGYHAMSKLSPAVATAPKPAKCPKYQDVFGRWLCDRAATDSRLQAITPAMCEGSGMVNFAQQFPDQYYDVAIAEQHAVTLAAGMACEQTKPVVAIYSTFLQRGYDQLVHDVALQNLDVTFAIDRAGFVGQDGATHAGAYDLSYMRCIPNMIIAAPSGAAECRQLLETAYQHSGPAAVRYPRGESMDQDLSNELTSLAVGQSSVARSGSKIAILCFGPVLNEAVKAAHEIDATVVDMRWVKPLDYKRIEELAKTHDHIITVEDNAIAGGAGSGVSEYLIAEKLQTSLTLLGHHDYYMEHADQKAQHKYANIDYEGILNTAKSIMNTL